MADTYVIQRLVAWAEWSLRREDSGLGYPRSVPYVNLMPPDQNHTPGTPEYVDGCHEIDKCVLAVKATNKGMYEILMLHYRGGLQTVKQKLKILGCCEKTYYNKIQIAHRLVLGFLNDLAADINIPVPDYGVM